MPLSPLDAISQLESGGDYGNVTTSRNRSGQTQRALGKYGVMDFNVGPWTKEATGTELTPEQFLNNPQVQDAVARYKFTQYMNDYGPEGAARAWLGGPGGVTNPNATDALGTSTGDYGRHFMRLIGGQGASPAAANPATPSTTAQATTGGVLGAGGALGQLPAQAPNQAPAQAAQGGVLAGLQPNAPQLAPMAPVSPMTFPGGWQAFVQQGPPPVDLSRLQALLQQARAKPGLRSFRG